MLENFSRVKSYATKTKNLENFSTAPQDGSVISPKKARSLISPATFSSFTSQKKKADQVVVEGLNKDMDRASAEEERRQTCSRAAGLKKELEGIQKLNQLVELISDPVTHGQFKHHVVGVSEFIDCFLTGFTPSVITENFFTLFKLLTDIIKNQESDYLLIVPSLNDLITSCSKPITFFSLNDQRLGEDAYKCVCKSLTLTLSSPLPVLRIASLLSLRKIVSTIRNLARDDIELSPSNLQQFKTTSGKEDKNLINSNGNGSVIDSKKYIHGGTRKRKSRDREGEVEIPKWKMNLRNAITREVLDVISSAWKRATSQEREYVQRLEREVKAQICNEESELFESDDDDEEEEGKNVQLSDKLKGKVNSKGDINSDLNKIPTPPHVRPRTGAAAEENEVDFTKLVITRVEYKRQRSVSALEINLILKTVCDLSYFKPCAEYLVSGCGASDLVLESIKLSKKGDKRDAVCVEIIWNLLQLVPTSGSRWYSSEGAMEILYELLVKTLSLGYKLKERELRNDIIVILCLISNKALSGKDLELFEPFCELLLELSCGNEMRDAKEEVNGVNSISNIDKGNKNNENDKDLNNGNNNREKNEYPSNDKVLLTPGENGFKKDEKAKKNEEEREEAERKATLFSYPTLTSACSGLINSKYHYTCNNEDLQLKILVWGLLSNLSVKSKELAELIFGWGFIDILLCYINVHCKLPSVVRWFTSQLFELQEQILLILSDITFIGSEYFTRCSAPHVIQNYISECPEARLRNLAFTVLARLAATNTRPEVASAGILPLALQLLEESKDDAFSIECLSLLTDIVNEDTFERHIFLQCNGVQALIPFFVFNPTYHTTHREEVILSAFDCAWSCVFGDERNEEVFIRLNGVQKCLHAIEKMPIGKLPFLLAAFAELLKNRAAASLFRTWRSKITNKSAIQMFIEIWNGAESEKDEGLVGLKLGSKLASFSSSNQRDNEIKRVGSTLDIIPFDIIYNYTNYSGRRGISMDEEFKEIESIIVPISLQIKIYCCLSFVGFSDFKELSSSERATLAHIEMFEDICNDFAWINVGDRVRRNSVQPILPDQAKLDFVITEANTRRECLERIKKMYEEEERSRSDQDERRFYKTLIKRGDAILPDGVIPRGMTITQAKIHKALMLKRSFQNVQDSLKAAALEKANALSFSSAIIPGASSPPNQLLPQSIGFPSFSPSVPFTVPEGLSTAAGIAGGESETVTSIIKPHQREQREQGSAFGSSTLTLKGAELTETNGGDNRRTNTTTSVISYSHPGLFEVLQAITPEELELLNELNKLRTDPASYVPLLEAQLSGLLNNDGKGESGDIHSTRERSLEKIKAIEEAIDVLKTIKPVSHNLTVPRGMLFATRDHLMYLMAKTSISSVPIKDGGLNKEVCRSDINPLMLLMSYGKVPQKYALLQFFGNSSKPSPSNNAYPSNTPQEIVLELLIDDGIESRIDRKNLLDPFMMYCAVSLGTSHPIHGIIAVITLAYEYIDKPYEEQNDINRKIHAITFSSR